MKKAVKTLSVAALCVVMIIMAVVPAFAAAPDVTYTENHNVIDCSNRYKEGTSEFHFTIKVPKGISFSNVWMSITTDYNGSVLLTEDLNYFSSQIRYSYSDSTYDYYEYVTGAYSSNGIGIKLFCYYNGGYYMATDTGIGQTTPGRGYWQAA